LSGEIAPARRRRIWSKDARLGPRIRVPEKALARHRGRALTAPAPTLLYQDLSLAQRVLRDIAGESTGRIIIDSREKLPEAQEFAAEYTPKVLEKLEHYTGERPLFISQRRGRDRRALARRVELKSGATSSSKPDRGDDHDRRQHRRLTWGTRSFDDTIFKTNLEAAQVIARQLRLRNLGGIIIIDFIDMESAEHRSAVLAELNKALARDRTRISVNRLHRTGAGRDDRKRTRESLEHVLLRALHDLRRARRGEDRADRCATKSCAKSCARRASSTRASSASSPRNRVIDLFLEEESQSLAMLGDFIGKPVSMQVETSYGQEQFDIILM